MRRRQKVAIWIALVLPALVAAFFLWSRYTDLGVFVGGGGTYWVQRAVEAEDPVEARRHLQRVLSSTNYGVNTAQNAARNLPRKEDRIRLWRLLMEIAPNDHWRQLYSLDLDRDVQAATPSHNQSLHLTRARATITQS